jgi:hypothetical protein
MKVIVRAIRESSRVSRALYGAAMDIVEPSSRVKGRK